jgi:hypothetical protein
VFVCEGEKDVHSVLTAWRMAVYGDTGDGPTGIAATTFAGGTWRPEYEKHFVGAARVIVVADRDPAGYMKAAERFRALTPIAADVVVVEAREGNDVTDHLDAGHPLEDLAVITDEISQLGCEKPVVHQPPLDRDNRVPGYARRQSYVRAAFDEEMRRVARAQPGERVTTLFAASCAVGNFVGADQIIESVAYGQLVDAAAQCGLSEREARPHITRGLQTGAAQPREMP